MCTDVRKELHAQRHSDTRCGERASCAASPKQHSSSAEVPARQWQAIAVLGWSAVAAAGAAAEALLSWKMHSMRATAR